MAPFYMRIEAIYDYMVEYQGRYGEIPTIKEIEAAVGINYSTVQKYLGKMELMGMIERKGEGRGRDINLIRREANWNALIEAE